ncbi:MAG TPA: hypothetical protein DER58_03725 [Firmicutes bacterium]|jgi:hypothetical protein|nr:hypothetical protein [Bacillota bacterium]
MSLTVQKEVLKAENIAAQHGTRVVIEKKLVLSNGAAPDKIILFMAEAQKVQGEAGNGYVTVTGLLEMEALYSEINPDGQLELSVARWSEAGGTAVPFETTVELPGAASGGPIQTWVEVEQAGAVPGDGDSLDACITLSVNLRQSRQAQYTVVNDLLATPPVQLRNEHWEFESLEPVGAKNIEWAIDEELTLPVSMPDADHIVWWQIRVTDLETRVGTDTVYLNGALACEVLYVSAVPEDDEEETQPGMLQLARWSENTANVIHFTHGLEWPGLDPECVLNATIRFKGTSVEAFDARKLRLQARATSRLEAALPQTVALLENCTAETGETIDLQKKPAEITQYLYTDPTEHVIRDTVALPFDVPEIERIFTVLGRPINVTAEPADEKVLIEGALELTLLYQGGSAEAAEAGVATAVSWIGDEALPFQMAIDVDDLTPDALVDPLVTLRDIDYEMLGPDKVHIDALLTATVKASVNRRFMAVTNAALITADVTRRKASMLFYLVQTGDTLWEIARRYNTTVSHLAEANDVSEDDAVQPGIKLQIPKA